MRGFSLVELSIVLVILGLLTGGILAGQSLIRASELRAVSTEYQRYAAAVNTFRDKYFAVPGDITTATRFWGDDNTNCPDAAIPNGTPGTCNGNGDGRVPWGVTEQHRFWQQLALAGLIEGSYSGLAGGAGAAHVVPGTNAPISKLSSGGWAVADAPNYAGDASTYGLDYGNYFSIGGAMTTNQIPLTAIMKPEEAWNIDTKLDDGRPAYGKIIARRWNNACATGGATATDLAPSVYNLSDSANQCTLYFVKQF